jgi:hypothetical protein
MERMRIADNGNVGIGTTTPLALLHLGNTGYTFAAGGLAFGDGDSGLYESADDTLSIRMGGADKVLISSGGDIKPSVDGSPWLGTTSNRWERAYFKTSVSVGTGASPETVISATGNSYFGGNVGIGTTTPVAKLDVYGTAGSADIFALSSSTNSRLFTVGANGNVGVGTANPGTKLEVNGTAAFSGRVSFNTGNPQNWYMQSNASNGLDIHTYSEMNFSNDNGTAMVIYRNGNVGIGTTNPGANLEIKSATSNQLRLGTNDGFYYTIGRSIVSGDLNFTASVPNQNYYFDGTLHVEKGFLAGSTSTFGWNESYFSRNVADGEIIMNLQNHPTANWLTKIGNPGAKTIVRGALAQTANLQEWQDSTGAALTVIDKAGNVGIGTTTPGNVLTVATGSIRVSEKVLTPAGSMTINWREGNQQLVRISTTGITMTFSNYEAGQNLKLVVCNPDAGTPGTITWPGTIAWSGGSAPSQTLTNSKCDIWSFIATMGTSTLNIFGAQSPEF